MNRESIVLGVAGVFFGLIVGWILGSQQRAAGPAMAPAQPAAATATPGGQAGGGTGQAPTPLDEARVGSLRARADSNPQDAAVRAELGNVYFDAERFDEAITWYEEAVRIDARNVDVSTDLGVSYYYTNQPDRALQQFERSLGIDPKHTKTLLNLGIVRAFGKQDLDGASAAWRKVIELAPDGPEGRAARQALDGLKSAHPGLK